MQYSFDPRDIAPEIYRLLELSERAQQQQQQQEQKQPTPAETVDSMTMPGVIANKDAYNQQQAAAQMQAQMQPQIQPQQQPYLNPQTAHLLGQVVNNKDEYEHADTYALANNPNEKDKAVLEATANDIRTMAHAGNDRIRELAKAIGLDLTGYENVGYEDAAKTLQDRKAKEIAELMGNTGKYSVTTDQFFNDNYLALIGEGKSAREAKRIAGRRAQEYQADRVTYLRNAFNVHGLDGNYVNGTGVDILNEMATEMPTVANVYAQAYQLPTQLQDRFNTLQDKEIAQANSLAQIAATGNVNMNLQKNQNEYDASRLDKQFQQTLQRLGIEHDYEQSNIRLQRDLDLRNERDRIRLTAQYVKEKPDETKKVFNSLYSAARMYGLSEGKSIAFAREGVMRHAISQYYGVGKSDSSGGKKSDNPKYTEGQQTFLNNVDNLSKRAHDHPDEWEPIEQLEALITGNPDDPKSIKSMDFPPAQHQYALDTLNALKGMYYKHKADDNTATMYFSKVVDVDGVLEKMYPQYNWDWYRERRGLKPKQKTVGDKLK